MENPGEAALRLIPCGATPLGFRELVVGLRMDLKYACFNIFRAVVLNSGRVSNFSQ